MTIVRRRQRLSKVFTRTLFDETSTFDVVFPEDCIESPVGESGAQQLQLWGIMHIVNNITVCLLTLAFTSLEKGPQITGELINDLSIRIAPMWDHVARRLKPKPFDYYEIETIKNDHQGNARRQAEAMLDKWRENSASEANACHLCLALLDEGMKAAASEILGPRFVENIDLMRQRKRKKAFF